MASWMIHLRIADTLAERILRLDTEAFIMGNIAPDSGEPSADETYYIPSKDLSHYRVRGEDGKNRISPEAFAKHFFTEEKRSSYSERQFSFYLGYLVHLLTDVMWVEKVLKKSMLLYATQPEMDKHTFMERCKTDWYDQDHLFLRKNPEFRAFAIYKNTEHFVNTYMDCFSANAFENKQKYILAFYAEEHLDLDREYVYFSEEEADAFVGESSLEIRNWLDGKWDLFVMSNP